jgi:hypothetical protein
MKLSKSDAERAAAEAAWKLYKNERVLMYCAANRDGECAHKQCPQLKDNEPACSGRSCPMEDQDE